MTTSLAMTRWTWKHLSTTTGDGLNDSFPSAICHTLDSPKVLPMPPNHSNSRQQHRPAFGLPRPRQTMNLSSGVDRATATVANNDEVTMSSDQRRPRSRSMAYIGGHMNINRNANLQQEKFVKLLKLQCSDETPSMVVWKNSKFPEQPLDLHPKLESVIGRTASRRRKPGRTMSSGCSVWFLPRPQTDDKKEESGGGAYRRDDRGLLATLVQGATSTMIKSAQGMTLMGKNEYLSGSLRSKSERPFSRISNSLNASLDSHFHKHVTQRFTADKHLHSSKLTRNGQLRSFNTHGPKLGHRDLDLMISDDFERLNIPRGDGVLSNKRSHVVVLPRDKNGTFGFTIRMFAYRRIKKVLQEKVFYINNVDNNSVAAMNGLKYGDVLLSVNGLSPDDNSLSPINKTIDEAKNLRLVVSDDHHIKRAAISNRKRELEATLQKRINELADLNKQEKLVKDTLNEQSSARTLTSKHTPTVTQITVSRPMMMTEEPEVFWF